MTTKKRKNRIIKKYKVFLIYALIGTIAAILDMSLLYLFSDVWNLNLIVSNMASVFFSLSLSFYLNVNYNFKSKDDLLKKYISFFIICFSGMVLGSGILYILYMRMDMHKFIAKLVSVIIAGMFQYLFNKNVTFR